MGRFNNPAANATRFRRASVKFFAFCDRPPNFRAVNAPLALLLGSRGLMLVPLTARLEEQGYRVATLTNPVELVTRAELDRAMVVFADLEGDALPVLRAVELLRANPATAHIPVLTFARELDDAAQAAAMARGATAAVPDGALLGHLSHLLERALEL